MEPLLWFPGNYISLETKSKTNEQTEAQKRAGAGRHNEFSGHLLSMATLLNTHFEERRETFPTLSQVEQQSTWQCHIEKSIQRKQFVAGF